MDPNERVMVNYRIPRGLKEKLDVTARKHGKSVTGFVRQVLEFACYTDAEFFVALTELAAKHQWVMEQARLEERRRNIE